MIKLQIIGHLGKDATVNTVNGKQVINFTVAHSEKYKDAQGNQVDKTTWADCAYWSDRTAVAPYLKKGTLVFAEGAPDVRTWTAPDGRSGAALTLRVSSIQLLGGKNEPSNNYSDAHSSQQTTSYQSSSPSKSMAQEQPPFDSSSDDLPF